MGTHRECVCCRECEGTFNKLHDNIDYYRQDNMFDCITNLPGFQAICLNPFVLQVAWLSYKQHYTNAYEGPDHKKYRHIAYRQYIRWVHGFVGKNIRSVIPSCAVCCIQAHFPPPGLEEDFEFTGFMLPEL